MKILLNGKLSFTLLTLISASLFASAQGGASYAVLYSDDFYEGPSHRLLPGEALQSLGEMGDGNWPTQYQRIRSIEIHGNMVVEFWDESHFRGSSFQISQSAGSLSQLDVNEPNWRDRIRSIHVRDLEPRQPELVSRQSEFEPPLPTKQPIIHNQPAAGEVKIFKDANYRGDSVAFDEAQAVLSLNEPRRGISGWNDQISSIHINGPFSVILYQDAYLKGHSIRIDESILSMASLRYLDPRKRNWNDAVSSMEIISNQPASVSHPRPSGRSYSRKEVVAGTLFEHSNYDGRQLTLYEGQEIRDLSELGWNDRATSIMVENGFTIVLFKHANFSGESVSLNNHHTSLRLAGRGWNDAASSLIVQRRN